MDFLANLPDFLRMVLALGFVVALMGGLALIVRKLGLGGVVPATPGSKRLKIVERLSLDARRQLVLLQRDDVTHLVILNPNGDSVIETGIKSDD